MLHHDGAVLTVQNGRLFPAPMANCTLVCVPGITILPTYSRIFLAGTHPAHGMRLPELEPLSTHPPMRSLTPSRPHHFLFLLPESTTSEEAEIVETAARKLTSLGYVYVASPHQPTMEDRAGVRFMPLRLHRLPCFGAVTGVMIVRDRHLTLAAQEAYPEAQIIAFDPAGAPHEDALRDLPMALFATAALRPAHMAKAPLMSLSQAA